MRCIVGYPRARYAEIMMWARENHYIVITLDLDYAEILAATNATGPSVIQLRARHGIQALTLASAVVSAITEFNTELEAGAIISIDLHASRLRLLPFRTID